MVDADHYKQHTLALQIPIHDYSNRLDTPVFCAVSREEEGIQQQVLRKDLMQHVLNLAALKMLGLGCGPNEHNKLSVDQISKGHAAVHLHYPEKPRHIYQHPQDFHKPYEYDCICYRAFLFADAISPNFPTQV